MGRLDPLAFLRKQKTNKKVMKVPSETRSIKKVSSAILESISSFDLDEGTIFDIKLCIEEAVRNAIVHGNQSNRRLIVRVAYWLEGRKLVIEVTDQGKGFDHRMVDDPTLEKHITKSSGRGVYLIKKLMDEVIYTKAGNTVWMIKNLK